MRVFVWIVVAAVAGFAAAVFKPEWAQHLHATLARVKPANTGNAHGHGHGHGDEHAHGDEGKVKLSAEQIASAGIETAAAGPASLLRELQLPGTVTIAPEQLAMVVARVPGVLVEARKRLGDAVAAGEVVAVIDSRETADATGDYLAALRAEELARATHQREEGLWRKRVSPEQDLLQARNALEMARIKLDQARRRLATLGLTTAEIAALPSRKDDAPRLHEVRAAGAGRVIERRAITGAYVAPDTELYQIADLSSVLAELSAAPADLAAIRDGAPLRIFADGREATASVVLISPRLDPETRRARVLARLPNADGIWRSGDFVTAAVETGRVGLQVAVPRTAVHTIKGEAVVFVRTDEGFEAREVALGQGDEKLVEIAFGVDPGEQVATRYSFVVKAELGKAEAEHSH
jgi:membrane fusion protein, heavy metal efflux system